MEAALSSYDYDYDYENITRIAYLLMRYKVIPR